MLTGEGCSSHSFQRVHTGTALQHVRISVLLHHFIGEPCHAMYQVVASYHHFMVFEQYHSRNDLFARKTSATDLIYSGSRMSE